VCFFFFFSLVCLRFVVAGVTATKRKPSSFSFSISHCCCCFHHFYIEDDNDDDDEEEESMTKKKKKKERARRKSFSSSSSLSFFLLFSRVCFSLSLRFFCASRSKKKVRKERCV